MTRRRLLTFVVTTLVIALAYFSLSGERSEAGRSAKAVDYVFPQPDEDIPACNTRGLALNARSVVVVDNSNDAWIFAKRPMQVRPIASLTKLLTAMVYLDSRPNLDTVVYISNRDCYNSAKSHIYKGEAYKAKDLLYAAVMASDNRAARALATASGMARLRFIEKMNDKARALGMVDTEVFEVTGLDERNVATAADIAIMVKAAMKYPLIKKISNTYTYRCKLQNRKKRHKNFINTNRLVRSRWRVQSGKTGFIIESDYCLATVLNDKKGHEITLVVLGAPTNNTRFSVARKLAFYGFKKAGRNSDGTEQIAGR